MTKLHKEEPLEREIILEVKDLHKIYGAGENAVRALDGIDLKVYSRELLVILGSSGSGKPRQRWNMNEYDAADIIIFGSAILLGGYTGSGQSISGGRLRYSSRIMCV